LKKKKKKRKEKKKERRRKECGRMTWYGDTWPTLIGLDIVRPLVFGRNIGEWTKGLICLGS
jgi:hypothetical protein